MRADSLKKVRRLVCPHCGREFLDLEDCYLKHRLRVHKESSF